jgi:hypothetical protein
MLVKTARSPSASNYTERFGEIADWATPGWPALRAFEPHPSWRPTQL